MQDIWAFITGKTFAAMVYAAIMLAETRRGFLKPFKVYARSLSYGVYLKIFGMAVATAVTLLFFDKILMQQVEKIENLWAVGFIELGGLLGRSATLWGLLAWMYALSVVLHQHRLQKIAFAGLLSSGLTSLFVHLLKYVFVRARPLMEMGPYHFFDYQGFLEHGSKFLSFSSGDVAVSAGAMSLIFFAVRHPVRWTFPGLALLTCLSRLYYNKHWPSDVAFSFLISFAVAKFVWDYCKSVAATERKGVKR